MNATNAFVMFFAFADASKRSRLVAGVSADGLGATIQRGVWPEPPIFEVVRRISGASDEDLLATFNMGLGLVLVVPPPAVEAVLANGAIGVVEDGTGVRFV